MSPRRGLCPVGVVMQEITRLSHLTSLMYSCTSIFSPATNGLMGSFSFIYKKVHYINQKNPKLNVTIKTFIDNKNHSFVQLYRLLKVHVQYMYKLYDIHTQI